MVYYSAPIAPAVTKAMAIETVSGDTVSAPRVYLNTGLPDNGTSGDWTQLPSDQRSFGTTSATLGAGSGEAIVQKAFGEDLTDADLNNLMVAISETSVSITNQNRHYYEFEISPRQLGGNASANGHATNRAYSLPVWPSALYGANLENRPAEHGGPWNPYDDDPSHPAPATATGWEVVEPGRVVETYLVRRSECNRNDVTFSDGTTGPAGDVDAWITLEPNQGYPSAADWTAPTAKASPLLSSWMMPDPGRAVYDTITMRGTELPATAYAATGLYSPPPGGNTLTPWPWRTNGTTYRHGIYYGGIFLYLVHLWQPPVYRWLLSEPPPTPGLAPLRQRPRSDGHGASSAARHYPTSRSVQASNRHRGGYS